MAEIPLGNFGYRAPDPVIRTQIDTSGFDAANIATQRAANTAFGVASEMHAEKQREQEAMQQAEAANKIGQYEMATKAATMQIGEDMRSGKLSYDQANAAFEKAMQGVPRPTVEGMRPELAARFNGSLDRVMQGGSMSLMPEIEQAKIGKFRSDIDGILDAQGKQAGFAGADIESINARLDAMDEQGRMAYGPDWEKKKQSAKDMNWYTSTSAQIMAAGDNVGALNAIRARMNSPEFADKLDANNRLSLSRGIEGKVDALNNRAEISAMRRESKAERAVAEYNQQISTGIPPKPEDRLRWENTVAGTSFSGEFEKIGQDEQVIRDVLRKPISEQVDYINQRTEDLKKNGGNMTDIANTNRIINAVQANVKMLSDSPLLYSEQREDRQLQPITVNSLMVDDKGETAANFSDRIDTLNALRQKNPGMVKVRPLLQQEADAIGGALKEASPEEQTRILGGLRKNIGDDEAYKGALAQINKDSPIQAVAGAIYTRDPETSSTILRGNRMLNPPKDGEKIEGAVPSDANLLQAFTQKYGDAFAGRPDAFSSAFNATKAYYAGANTSYGNKEVDIDLMDKAMASVVGDTYKQKGVTTLLPQGMNEDDFRDGAHLAFEAARERGAILDRDFDDYGLQMVNGKTYQLLNGKQAVLDASGRPVRITIGDKPSAQYSDDFSAANYQPVSPYGSAH